MENYKPIKRYQYEKSASFVDKNMKNLETHIERRFINIEAKLSDILKKYEEFERKMNNG